MIIPNLMQFNNKIKLIQSYLYLLKFSFKFKILLIAKLFDNLFFIKSL